MRFLEDSADIPDELIGAVTDGDAVFLCGAGVSLRAGLPTFKGLTDQVYQKLGETRANEAAERWAYDREEYDRVLRSLEKRTYLRRAPSRVRMAVAEILTAPTGVACRII
jgi:NAD-dependent SIR2 family protein deacetylase